VSEYLCNFVDIIQLQGKCITEISDNVNLVVRHLINFLAYTYHLWYRYPITSEPANSITSPPSPPQANTCFC